MGATRGAILRLFLIDGLVIGGVGIIIGVVLSVIFFICGAIFSFSIFSFANR
jgi:ABC-type lipoprotein release transport system permease subunit